MSDNALMPIPGLGVQDVAVVQSLLRQERFFFRVHESFGEPPDVILIRVRDLPAVRKLLADYRVRDLLHDRESPIPW
jgi:hypothetical protein